MPTAPLILFVDDHADTRELYTLYFEGCGFRVIGAADADEAYRLAAAQTPDAIVTDLALPAIDDGVALIRCLRSDEATAGIPVVVVSGAQDPVRNAELQAFGVDQVLVKPVLPDELCRQVEMVLGAV